MPTKVSLVKAMVFPVVMYGCESWTIKKAERWRIDDFQLWCWRRLLRVSWTARISNQSILKEISPGCSLEGLLLKMKLQYFGHLMQRADSFEKTLTLGKIESGRRRDDRGWDGWMASPTQSTRFWASSGSWWWTVKTGVLQSMGSQSQTWLSDWAKLFFYKSVTFVSSYLSHVPVQNFRMNAVRSLCLSLLKDVFGCMLEMHAFFVTSRWCCWFFNVLFSRLKEASFLFS